jgi:hypothetical protein
MTLEWAKSGTVWLDRSKLGEGPPAVRYFFTGTFHIILN